MRKIKILSFILAVVMLISSVNMLAFAEGPAVADDFQSLAAAVEVGGDIEVGGRIAFEGPLTITKDTTICFTQGDSALSMDNSYIMMQTGLQAENMFVVEGATLTFDFSKSYGVLNFNGSGSPIKLVGAQDKETKLVIRDNGSFTTNSIQFPGESGFTYAKSFIDIENPDNNAIAVRIEGASISVEKENAQGDVFSGDGADIKIISGMFSDEKICDFVDDNSVIVRYEGDSFDVLKIDAEPIDAVADFFEDGKLIFKRPRPKNEVELQLLYDEIYYAAFNRPGDYYLDLVKSLFDADSGFAYVKVTEKETGNVVQGLKVPIAFEYDEEMISQVKDIIDALPKGENGEPYCYSVTDLEMLNFWLTTDEDNCFENINNFINYSDEFKRNLGYKNFAANIGYGADEPLYTFCGGTAQFYYNGVSYGYTDLEVKGEHIFYVPDNTADTPDALLEAFKERVNAYLGEGAIEPIYLGTALEVLLRDAYESTRYQWEQYDPDMTFEEWKQSDFCPVADSTPIFAVEINGLEHKFLIVKDSSKMTVPQFKNVDFKSDVSVQLNNAAIPLDTVLQVEIPTSGEEYEKIQQILKPQKSKTFDINLHSTSMDDYVTRITGGEFEVRLPVPEGFEDKELKVYYVGDEEVESYDITFSEDKDFVVFTTTHFSAYTLTATEKTTGGVSDGGAGSTQVQPTPESPKTADTRKTELWTVLSAMSLLLLAATVYCKVKFEI